MNVLAEVQRQLSSWAPLTSRMAADRIFTALAAGPAARPYAVVRLVEVSPTLSTSSRTRVERWRLAIDLYADDLDTGEKLASEVCRRLQRRSFACDGGRVLDGRCRLAALETPNAEVWRLEVMCELVCEQRCCGGTNDG